MYKTVVILFSLLLTSSDAFAIVDDEMCKIHEGKMINISASGVKPLTIETLLIDPQGRKTGFDPEVKIVKEDIPCTLGYWEDSYGGDVPPARFVAIRPTIDGIYSIKVYSPTTTHYNLSIYFRDTTRKRLHIDFSGILSGGAVTEYKVDYDSTSVEKSAVTPELFDGKGQRAIDVNTFLAYAGPSQGRTNLPAGQTTYDVAIYYGKTIQPGTFKATLSRTDITNSFHPAAGSSELVNIPLQQGRNTLVLSVKGTRSDGRQATDTDRLVFLVQ